MSNLRMVKHIAWLVLAIVMVLSACATSTTRPSPSPTGALDASPGAVTPSSVVGEEADATTVAKTTLPLTPTAGNTSDPSGSPTVVPTLVPKIVRIGMPEEPDTITGWPGGSYAAAVVQNLLFNVLVGVDHQMEPFPDLAEEVPTIANGGARWVGEGADRHLEVTFRLRRGVTWSDGQPFTARDVVFTWELMLNKNAGAAPDTELKYEKVVAVNDYTVVFTFFSERSARAAAARDPDRYGRFKDQVGPVIDPLYIFGLPNSYIYPAHVVGPLVDNEPMTSVRVLDLFTRSSFAKSPVGTGPYTLKAWTAGTSLTFVARKDYFRGAPKIDSVVFRIVPKAETLIRQLKDGEIDVITQDALDVTNAPLLDTLENASVHYTPGIAWEHLDLNLSDPILGDKNVREAINLAINRQELVEKVLLDKAVPANSVVPFWSWAYDNSLPTYSYDPIKAASLLDQSGWIVGSDGIREKNGQKLRLKLQTTDAPFRMKTAPLLRDELRRVGIDLIVEHLPYQQFFEERTGPLSQRTYQVAEYAWVSGFDPGVDLGYAFHSRSIPSPENNYVGGNYTGYRNPEVDRLLDRGLATLDRSERIQVYHELQEILLEDFVTIPLYVHPNITAASKRLANFKPARASIGETWNIHEWDLK